MRIVFWGTYDTGKPRVRILLRGLKENGVEVIECHSDVWEGVEDKSQIKSWIVKIRYLVKYLKSYPLLVFKYLCLPKHDAVVVSYLGQFDVLVISPFAKFRGTPVVWDAFISLYATIVEDRKMIEPRQPLAFILYAWEWLACRTADFVLLDTRAHADYFVRKFNIPKTKTGAVFVGAETDFFPTRHPNCKRGGPRNTLTILFYGQFIPLHGIETIILAARQLEGEHLRWVIIGQGQEELKILDMLNKHPLPNMKWIPWVPYKELNKWIHRADICLGIFGDSDKAARVIPNKVFQILSSGKPLITRDSPAIRELLNPSMAGVFLVPPADPTALAESIHRFLEGRWVSGELTLHQVLKKRIAPVTVGCELFKLISGFL